VSLARSTTKQNRTIKNIKQKSGLGRSWNGADLRGGSELSLSKVFMPSNLKLLPHTPRSIPQNPRRAAQPLEIATTPQVLPCFTSENALYAELS
jgi:hypothetical protein